MAHLDAGASSGGLPFAGLTHAKGGSSSFFSDIFPTCPANPCKACATRRNASKAGHGQPGVDEQTKAAEDEAKKNQNQN